MFLLLERPFLHQVSTVGGENNTVEVFPWVGCCCSVHVALKREKLFFSSVGMTSSQSEMGTSVQASLQRADQEIKTALRKLMDSASLLVTLPSGMQGGADGLGLSGSIPSDHSARSSVLVHEASTQTQAAAGHGRFGVNPEGVLWESRGMEVLNTSAMILAPLIVCFVVF